MPRNILQEALINLLTSSPFGKNLPPPTGDVSRPANVAGRALGGTINDVSTFIKRFMPAIGPFTYEQIQKSINPSNVSEFIGAATGSPVNGPSSIPPGITPTPTTQNIPSFVPQPQPNMPLPESQPQQNIDLKSILLKLGVPLASTIAGSVNPNWLPQAAGLSTGYTEGVEKAESEQKAQKETERKEKLAIEEAKRAVTPSDWDIYKEASKVVLESINKDAPPAPEVLAKSIFDQYQSMKSTMGIDENIDAVQGIINKLKKEGKTIPEIQGMLIEAGYKPGDYSF